MSGNGAEEALRLYAASDFCLQPPGDTLPRPGMQPRLQPHVAEAATPCSRGCNPI